MQPTDELDDRLPRRIEEALGKALGLPGLALAAAPELIQPGPENLILGLSLVGAPPRLSGPLILRRFPPEREARGVRFEAALHRELCAQGMEVPAVHAVCDDPALLGGGFLLMERVPGRILLGEITRLDEVFASVGSAARALPRMVYEAVVRVPAVLADVQARLEALDAERLEAAVEAEGFAIDAFTEEGRLAQVERRAAEHGLDGLAPALEWLRARLRPPRRRVLCHADLQFLNVLVDGPRVSGVIDWSLDHCTFADPDFDVGNTTALLAIRLPGLPAALRPPLEWVQRILVARFRRLRARSHELDPERILFAEVFRYVREMVLAGSLLGRGEAAASAFMRDGEVPWLIPEVQQAVLQAIEARTGRAASLPEPA